MMHIHKDKQRGRLLDALYEQRRIDENNVDAIRLSAEHLHLLFDSYLQLPATDTPLVNAWFKANDDYSIPFKLVSGSNIGGLPVGSFVEPNGHMMEVVRINGYIHLQAVCEHDYQAC